MSLSETAWQIQRAKYKKELTDLLMRERLVTPDSALRLFDKQLEGIEYSRNKDESQLQYIFEMRDKYRSYSEKGIKYVAFLDPKSNTVEFRTVH